MCISSLKFVLRPSTPAATNHLPEDPLHPVFPDQFLKTPQPKKVEEVLGDPPGRPLPCPRGSAL